jgi:M6 family metalloprotease-like protein
MFRLDFFATVFFTAVLCLASTSLPVHSAFDCVAQRPAAAAAKPTGISAGALPATGSIRALVVFARFPDEEQYAVPDFASYLFDVAHLGSLAHFYDEMSFGQFQLNGAVLPRIYAAEEPARAFLAPDDHTHGDHGEFVRQIMEQVDRDIDLAEYDGDGDGTVDYVFVLMRSVPRRFLLGGADGIAGLGRDYTSLDGDVVVSGSRFRGALIEMGTSAQTVGVMAHEFGHALGMPDLFNVAYRNDPAQGVKSDGAGIGAWGLMGHGAHWNGDDGPNPFSAYSREVVGWIDEDNGRLVEATGDTVLRLETLAEEGTVLIVPLHAEFIVPDAVFAQEYLPLETRYPEGSYYDRHLPGSGVLIWHVRPYGTGAPGDKKVDLVSADGLYADAAFPLGREPDADGSDNLDFWAHDSAYSRQHGGNLGDATDPFGKIHTRFDTRYLPRRLHHAASSGLRINIHETDGTMVVTVRQPRWAGTIEGQVRWMGEVFVDGDVRVAKTGELVVYGHTRVRVSGVDRLQSGSDPRLCEVQIDGMLRVHTGVLTELGQRGRRTIPRGNVVFEGWRAGDTWAGVEGRVQAGEGELVLRDTVATRGLAVSVPTAVLTGESETLEFTLSNFPNPFNAATTLDFVLPAAAPVHLAVYNALGQRVRVLMDGVRGAGRHQTVWDGRDDSGRDLASGIYLSRLLLADQLLTRKLFLVR